MDLYYKDDQISFCKLYDMKYQELIPDLIELFDELTTSYYNNLIASDRLKELCTKLSKETVKFQQGFLIDTIITRTFSELKRLQLQKEEELCIFTNFHIQDEGRSRQIVCFMNKEHPKCKTFIRSIIEYKYYLKLAESLIEIK